MQRRAATGTRVWIARHAEVDRRFDGYAYGDTDVPLSEAGAESTERLGRELGARGLATVVSSPLSRAQALGEAASRAAGVELVLRDGLRELDRGRWLGRKKAELERTERNAVEAYHQDPWSYTGHGGETDRDILARARPVLDETVARGAGGEVLLCTHYNVARVLAADLLGIPPKDSFALRLDPGGLLLFLDDARGWSLLRANVPSPKSAGDERLPFDGQGPPARGAHTA